MGSYFFQRGHRLGSDFFRAGRGELCFIQTWRGPLTLGEYFFLHLFEYLIMLNNFCIFFEYLMIFQSF